jgi:signal transduction histidine kinase
MRTTSITNKMALYFVSLSFTVVGILGLLSYLQTKDALFERTLNQLNTIKSVKKRQLTKFFDERVNDVRTFVKNIKPTMLLKDVFEDKIFTNYISNFLRNNWVYEEIIISEGYNSIVFSICDDSLKAKFMQNDSNYISELFFMSTHELVDTGISKSFKIITYEGADNNSNITSILVQLSIKPEAINQIMLEQSPGDGFGNSVESYLVGTDLLMRTNSRFIDSSVLDVKVETNGLELAKDFGDSTAIYKDYRNVEVLGSFGIFEFSGIKWYIFAEIDEAEAYKPLNNMLYNMLLYTIGISIILFFFTYYLSKRFMMPIKNLTAASEVISSGNYPGPVEVINNDELGVLASTFNNMIERMKQQEQELENERLERISASIDSMDADRKRLSRELHDGLGQAIIAIKLKLESIESGNPEISTGLIANIKSDIDNTISEIRNISNDLMPSVLTEFGIVNALRNMCEEMNEHSKIETNFSSNMNVKLSGREETYIYRIAQEALKNIIKHSAATYVKIELFSMDNNITLIIEDNGIGFESDKISNGNGIFNMRERAKILDGKLSIVTSNNKGTEITFSFKTTNFG